MNHPDWEFWVTQELLASRMGVQYSLIRANGEFAKAIGDQRHEDVEFKKKPKARKIAFLGK